MKFLKEWSSKILVFLILCGCLWGIFQNAGDLLRENVYVWKEDQDRRLPIYCVDTKKKVLALTFDVAWGNEDMEEVLRILKQEKVEATFFFSGEWMENYPADVKKIAKAGHDIGNHGDHHKYMTKLSKEEQIEEIRGANDKAKALLGTSMELFRPPYGDYDSQVVETAESMGCYVIQWSVDSLDWMEPGADAVIEKVCGHKDLKSGAILLMHTGTQCTKKALKPMIQKLKRQGYGFVPVSELIYRENYRIDPSGMQIKN
nr:polysaccharide deacetylase family protein [uncultured Anaerostipes sp.]